MVAKLLSIEGDKPRAVIMERRACDECNGSLWIWRTAMDDVTQHHLVCATCDVGPIPFVGMAECDSEGE